VEGSFADGSAMATSDLDLAIVFRDRFETGEFDEARKLATGCRSHESLELDVGVYDELSLSRGVPPMLKLGGRLIWGDEVLGRMPLVPIDVWARERMHASYWLLVNVFARPPVVDLPVNFPDPMGEFYGYQDMRAGCGGGSSEESTRNLVRVTGWMATALVALHSGTHVVAKQHCHTAYRRLVGDRWSPFLEDVYQTCRGRWAYRVPEDRAGRDRLRKICERTLGFENRFLRSYRSFLVSQLRRGSSAAQRDALWLMERIPYRDQAVRAAAAAVAERADPSLRGLAIRATARLEAAIADG